MLNVLSQLKMESYGTYSGNAYCIIENVPYRYVTVLYRILILCIGKPLEYCTGSPYKANTSLM